VPEPARHHRLVLADALPAGGHAAEDVAVAFCPRCGASMSGAESFVQEYWMADQTVYNCWCRECDLTWELVRVERVVTHEAAE
jgi:formate dehydrogenase maturation protein FdhE